MRRLAALIAPAPEVEQIFWERVDMEGDCWLWLSTHREGVGVFAVGGRILYAHRLAFAIFRGSVAPNADVRRTCGNLACVRPLHLLLVPKGRKGRAELAYFASPAGEWLM
jgi:hypothetical protein